MVSNYVSIIFLKETLIMDDKKKVKTWRQLFRGNQNNFGRRIVYVDQVSGKQVRRYHPVRKPPGPDGTQDYEPLTDNYILDHINGREELLIYLLHSDLTVGFFALDYDKEHNFADVKRTYDILTSLKIKAHIARSTMKGYHIYMFLDENIRSYYPVAIFEYIMDSAGFREDAQFNRRLMPETFPRNVGAPNLGHGIKPPLWGAGLPDHNCFVDTNDVPFPDQWGHAEEVLKSGVNNAKAIMDLVENHPEMVLQTGDTTVEKAAARRMREKPKYRAPTSGDFARVISKCPAVHKIWNKPTNMATHEERVAMLAFAKATANGIQMVRDKYGNSDEANRQIDYAIETNQLPWTCSAMMQHGFCDKKVPCLKRLPPVEKIDGQVVINPHKIPEDQWPEPSCIRYAFNSDIDACVLKDEILKFKNYQGEDRDAVLENLVKNLIKLDTKQRLELEEVLADIKVFKSKATLTKFIKQIELEVNREENKKVALVPYKDGIELGSDDTGYIAYTLAKNGERVPTRLTNFRVFIEHTVSFIGIYDSSRIISGKVDVMDEISGGHKHFPFSIEADVFYSNGLIQAFANIAAPYIEASTGSRDTDIIRQCILKFGRDRMEVTQKFEDYGMRQLGADRSSLRYMAGDFIYVDRDGIKRDTNNYVDLSTHEVARGLRLRIIEEKELREVCTHIVKDVLTCHDPHVIYTSLAHSLQATIHDQYMPMPDKPTLWVQGLTGSGKTFVAEICAAFHGDSRTIMLNARTTMKSMESYGAVYKDALLIIDDYKHAMSAEMGMKAFIQNVYDSKARGRLRQNGKQNNAPRVRALVMVTAEDTLGAESSIMARTILIRTRSTSHLTEEDRAREKLIRQNMPLYPGVLAHFIRFVLNFTKEHFSAAYEKTREELAKLIGNNAQNGNRICNNLSANYVTFCHFCDFLLMYRAISSAQCISMKKEHWNNMQLLARQMAQMCLQEQASNVFLASLRELLVGGKYYVDGATTGNNNAERLGFCDKDDKGNILTVYLQPQQTIRAVQQIQGMGERISHGRDAIAQQLIQDKVIIRTYDGLTTVRKSFQGQNPYVWACDPEKLGFGAGIASVPLDDAEVPVDPNDPIEMELRAAEAARKK
jgi:hypothetical protein